MAKKKRRPNSIMSMTACVEDRLLDNADQYKICSNLNVGDFVDVSARMRIVGTSSDMRGNSLELQSDGAFTVKGVKS